MTESMLKVKCTAGDIGSGSSLGLPDAAPAVEGNCVVVRFMQQVWVDAELAVIAVQPCMPLLAKPEASCVTAMASACKYDAYLHS